MSNLASAPISLIDLRMPSRGFRPLTGHAPPAMQTPPAPDPYAQGLAAGAKAARDAHVAERDEWQAIISAIDALQPEPSEELAAMIAMTIDRLVTDIVGRITIDRDWLMTRIARAAALIAEADAARTIWLNPQDMALLEGSQIPLEMHADETLDRGAVRIDCSVGWIEDSRSIHLDALRAMLGTGDAS